MCALLSGSQPLWATTETETHGSQGADPGFPLEQILFQNRIDELIGLHGPLDFRLAEQWTTLGLAQQASGNHHDAIDSFESALNVERVHKGLHHPDQTYLLARLIQSNRALGAWPAVAQNHKLLQFINERGHTVGSPEHLETVKLLTFWHIEASELPTGIAPFSHLSSAKELVQKTLESVKIEDADSTLTSIELLELLAGISFRIARHVSTWTGDPIHGVTQDAIVTASVLDSSELIFRQNLIVSNYTGGQAALERALELAKAQKIKSAQARAEQHLGDWHLLFDRRQTAAKHYQTAARLAGEAGIGLFEHPRRLPNFVDGTDLVRAPVPDGGHVHYVRTRFDIDRKGRAKNVRILEVHPAGMVGMERNVREQLRKTRFRPKYDGGRPIESKDVEYRFVLPRTKKAN
jgi:tetratricopeptide (TPR) repeat protein